MTRTCVRCDNAFDAHGALYAAIGTPAPVECVVCRLTQKHQPEGNGVTKRTPAGGVASSTRRAHPERAKSWSRGAALAAVHTWALAHGRLPLASELDADTALPTSTEARRLFRTIRAMDAAYAVQYPEATHTRHAPYTVASILACVVAWRHAHAGQVPLTRDFQRDAMLPSPSIVYQHVGTLEALYARLEGEGVGGCLAQYQAAAKQHRLQAARRGQQTRPRREARERPWWRAHGAVGDVSD